MTIEAWDQRFDEIRLHLQNDRGLEPREAWERARILTRRELGERPSGLSITKKVGLWFARRKLEKAMMDGKASPLPKWVLALGFGLLACYGVADLALADGVIEAREWLAIGNAFIGAALGKFSNPEKLVSPKPTIK
jgi:hypothetical protein